MAEDAVRGDVLTKAEMALRQIIATPTERGGLELRTRGTDKTIAHWLESRGYIEQYQINAASIFLDLRRAYEASMGVKWLSLGDQLIGQLQLTPGQATSLYDDIRHAIGVRNAGLVHRLVSWAMLTEASKELHEAEANEYRKAFDLMEYGMKIAKEKQKEVVSVY